MNDIEKLHEIIKNSKNIVFFGGAGVSTESGIPDFRSADGLYSNKEKRAIPPEVILSHSYFMTHTKDFYDYYRTAILHDDAKPNGAHIALAHLEKIGKLSAVVTQNIDGLHQMAGSERVYELHGTVHRNHCMRCRREVNVLDFHDGLPICPHCGGVLKPDVVLYEEALPSDAWNGSEMAIANADTLIVGGTSLTVYPARMLVDYFHGENLVIINRDLTDYDTNADLIIREPIGKVLEEAVRGID